jgi:hypothetical protein
MVALSSLLEEEKQYYFGEQSSAMVADFSAAPERNEQTIKILS